MDNNYNVYQDTTVCKKYRSISVGIEQVNKLLTILMNLIAISMTNEAQEKNGIEREKNQNRSISSRQRIWLLQSLARIDSMFILKLKWALE